MRLGVAKQIVVIESEIRIRSSISVRFEIKRWNRIDDCDIDIKSIFFLSKFDPFWLKDWCKDQKGWLKDQKKSIKRS